jgi:hypothetical protein
MRPLLAAAASEGPSKAAGSGHCETPGESKGVSHQRCMLRATQLAVLLLFQVQAHTPTNMHGHARHCYAATGAALLMTADVDTWVWAAAMSVVQGRGAMT